MSNEYSTPSSATSWHDTSPTPDSPDSPIVTVLHDIQKIHTFTKVRSIISRYSLVVLLCSFAAMGGFIFGYDTGTIAGYINMPLFVKNFGEEDSDGVYYFSKLRSGLIVGIFSIGAGIGGIFFSRLGDKYGRKVGVTIGCIIYIIGVIIQISAVTAWYQFLIGRVIGGLGVGTIAVLVPMFQSEVAPQEIRGVLVSIYQLQVTLGIFASYCICYGTKSRDDTGSYRIPLSLCFVWAMILIIGMVFMPESPRYLISKGRIIDARKSMCFLNRCSEDDQLISISIDNIVRAVDHEKEANQVSWKSLLSGKPKVAYRLLVGVFVLALQQLVGANYFFYYGTKVFRDIGMTDSFSTSMIFGAVNFISTFFGLCFVERFGRRNVLIYGGIGMLFFFIIYASLGAKALYSHGETNHSVGKGMIVVTCFYIFCFATSWAPCAFVLVSEIYPLCIRSKGMAIGLAANWLANFVLGFCSPFIIESIHFYYGYVFSGFILFAVTFVHFFVYETKGLSLEEIDEMFASPIKPWRSVYWVPRSSASSYSQEDLKPKAEKYVKL